MPEVFNYYEKGPIPTMVELLEGAELLLSWHGTRLLKPAINGPQEFELVVSAPFSDLIDGDGTTFVSKNLVDVWIQIEDYVTRHNPDGTRSYNRESVIDLYLGSEEYEDSTSELSEFYDELKRDAAKSILGIWGYYQGQPARSLAQT